MPPDCTKRTDAAAGSTAAPNQGEVGAIVTCACCDQELTLIHRRNGTHQVKRYSIHLADQQELPGFNT